jgi:hypothetical protein
MKGQGITTRRPIVPFVVFQDAETSASRCINPLHVQTFIASPFHTKGGTVITFGNGDSVTVADDFQHVFDLLTGYADG